MKLSDYLKELGETDACNRFGVSVFTIRAWRCQARYPSSRHALMIQAQSKGRVSYAKIFEGRVY